MQKQGQARQKRGLGGTVRALDAPAAIMLWGDEGGVVLARRIRRWVDSVN